MHQERTRRVLLVALVALLGAAGCGTAVSAADGSVSDGATDAVSDVASDATGDAAIVCGNGASVFPTFDRTCTTAADCVVAPHQTDCCGTIAALGIRREEQARFQAAEAVCDAMYPGCGCFTGQIVTDDGMTSRTDVQTVRVDCRAGLCATSVRAAQPCGDATCSPSQICVPGCCGVDGCTPPPPRCVDVPPSCATNPGCGCFPSNPCPTGSCVDFSNDRVQCLCA